MRNLPVFVALSLPLAACVGGDKEDDTATVDDTSVTDDTSSTEGALADGFQERLDHTGGCSDTWVQAWNNEDNVGLEIYTHGILDRAITAGQPVEEILTLGVDTVEVFVEIADPVAINYCTDALDQRTVEARYDAVSGRVLLNMAPPDAEWAPGTLSVELQDVILEDSEGHQVTVTSWSAADIAIIQAWGG